METILARTFQARRDWAAQPVERRCEVLRAAATALRSRRDSLARFITSEMGKPLRESVAEVEKCASTCDYYADAAPSMLVPRAVATSAAESRVTFEPLGTVLAVMPWNFPLWQIVRAAVPALAAGNAFVVKPAPITGGSAVALAGSFAAAGLPPGLFEVLVVDEPKTAETVRDLLADDRIDAVTFTGSEAAGAAIASAAGAAVKPSVLELGGSDAFVVRADADLAVAVSQAVRSRFLNAGQSCIAAKRFIVDVSVAEEFTTALGVAVSKLVVGDSFDPGTDIGPLARPDLVDTLDRQVRESVAAGARLVTGGEALPGGFYRPTVLADVRPDMAVCAEETFGPVAAVLVAADDDDAVRLANASRWGLGASVWSADAAAAREVAARLRSGAVFVNAVVASDPRLPFGGTGKSGFGRELGPEGLLAFVNVRTWWIESGEAHA
ncbi:aldehyde dehydrogenase family protein [Actinoplanes sp. NPDC051411]|uniref:aldehyde dehydrogenase family protein n=1 Tax=Actinoplanes sp. NPDC051411 TaxID=3155522 RepID=UPI00341660C1